MEINKDNLLFTHKTSVRMDDINFGNHLAANRMPGLLQTAKAYFLKKHELSEADCYGYGLILLNLEIQFCNQAFFSDELVFNIYLETLSRSTITFSYSISNEVTNKIIAKAKEVIGFFDLEKQRLCKPDERFIKIIFPD